MKTCLKCGGDLAPTLRSDARYCTEVCRARAAQKRHYNLHPGKMQESRDRHNARSSSRILARVKHRAKLAGLPFNLTPDDIVIPAVCPILSITLRERQGSGYHDDSPSLDRIIPALGYTKGNVRVISNRANLLKNNASSTELELVLNDLKRLGL